MNYFKRVSPNKTMCDTILDHLKQRGNISALEAHGMYKCRSLSRRICDLKARGYIIRAVMKVDNAGQRYARYHFVGKTDGRQALETIGQAHKIQPLNNIIIMLPNRLAA